MKTVILMLSFLTLPLAQDLVVTSTRGEINLNGQWLTNPSTAPSPIPVTDWTSSRVPAEPITDGTVALWYGDSIYIPARWLATGHRWFLNFDQVGHYSAVYVNGQLAGQNWGQFAPFSIEVTSDLKTGKNVFDVYVHDSDSTYAYQGANLDQSSCVSDGLPANCQALSYRSGANDAVSRNWVGVTGDVTLSWRPTAYIGPVVAVPSVRNSTLSAVVTVNGSGSYTVQSTVLDAGTAVLSLPSQAVTAGTAATLTPTTWTNPIQWGPPGYGSPKLYTLKTQLFDGNGNLLDTKYDSFGFREVWISGLSVLLNGVPLRAVGNYNAKLSSLRMSNDRRPLAAQMAIYQSSGLNMFVDHWDNNPLAYNLADEMGMLAEGSFYCNGALPQAEVDSSSAWAAFMEGATSAWAARYANHPSIVIWRPLDVLPEKADGTIAPAVSSVVAATDPQARPIADGGHFVQSIDYWGQDGDGSQPGTCADLTPLQSALASQTRPLFVKEIYSGQGYSCSAGMFAAIDGFMSTYPAMVGMVMQQMTFNTPSTFPITWESQSGAGNRPASQSYINNGMMPDWDSSWTPSSWSTQFAGLDPWTLATNGPQSGDFETLTPAAAVLGLVSASGVNPSGVTVDAGSAWFVTPWTGSGQATWYDASANIISTQTVTLSAPLPY